MTFSPASSLVAIEEGEKCLNNVAFFSICDLLLELLQHFSMEMLRVASSMQCLWALLQTAILWKFPKNEGFSKMQHVFPNEVESTRNVDLHAHQTLPALQTTTSAFLELSVH